MKSQGFIPRHHLTALTVALACFITVGASEHAKAGGAAKAEAPKWTQSVPTDAAVGAGETRYEAFAHAMMSLSGKLSAKMAAMTKQYVAESPPEKGKFREEGPKTALASQIVCGFQVKAMTQSYAVEPDDGSAEGGEHLVTKVGTVALGQADSKGASKPTFELKLYDARGKDKGQETLESSVQVKATNITFKRALDHARTHRCWIKEARVGDLTYMAVSLVPLSAER
jgi:hypothetical protein